jgi:hypothetical protein
VTTLELRRRRGELREAEGALPGATNSAEGDDDMSESTHELGTIREATSPAGHRVSLAIECASYAGAQPLYVIARYGKKGGLQDLRYLPVTYGLDGRRTLRLETRRAQARARAETIFEAFAVDITDPVEIRRSDV